MNNDINNQQAKNWKKIDTSKILSSNIKDKKSNVVLFNSFKQILTNFVNLIRNDNSNDKNILIVDLILKRFSDNILNINKENNDIIIQKINDDLDNLLKNNDKNNINISKIVKIIKNNIEIDNTEKDTEKNKENDDKEISDNKNNTQINLKKIDNFIKKYDFSEINSLILYTLHDIYKLQKQCDIVFAVKPKKNKYDKKIDKLQKKIFSTKALKQIGNAAYFLYDFNRINIRLTQLINYYFNKFGKDFLVIIDCLKDIKQQLIILQVKRRFNFIIKLLKPSFKDKILKYLRKNKYVKYVIDQVKRIKNNILKIINKKIKKIERIFKKIYRIFRRVLKWIQKGIRKTLRYIKTIFTKTVKKIANAIKAIIIQLFKFAKATMSAIWHGVTYLGRLLNKIPWINKLTTKIGNLVKNVGTKIKNFFRPVKNFFNAVGTKISKIKGIIGKIPKKIGRFFGNIATKIKNFFKFIPKKITNFLAKKIPSIGKLFGKKAASKVAGGSIKTIIKKVIIKILTILAKKIPMISVNACIPVIGWIVDLVMAALTIYDIYSLLELYPPAKAYVDNMLLNAYIKLKIALKKAFEFIKTLGKLYIIALLHPIDSLNIVNELVRFYPNLFIEKQKQLNDFNKLTPYEIINLWIDKASITKEIIDLKDNQVNIINDKIMDEMFKPPYPFKAKDNTRYNSDLVFSLLEDKKNLLTEISKLCAKIGLRSVNDNNIQKIINAIVKYKTYEKNITDKKYYLELHKKQLNLDELENIILENKNKEKNFSDMLNELLTNLKDNFNFYYNKLKQYVDIDSLDDYIISNTIEDDEDKELDYDTSSDLDLGVGFKLPENTVIP